MCVISGIHVNKELHSLLALHWFYNSISVIFAEFTGITMTLYERFYLYVQ